MCYPNQIASANNQSDEVQRLRLEDRREEREARRWEATRELRANCVATAVVLQPSADADAIVAEAKKLEAYISGASGA